ncbi:gp133 [Sphingomonas phage PAU]|uniref:gp133 n=1 Tax=Sphingomonas phage PAU TaxID=1150991 RepID=UPI0002573278|nr:gp133 [Sphingomonas phage PAU]AFF28131.1 gp133 [Sphingomonas phage PAU]
MKTISKLYESRLNENLNTELSYFANVTKVSKTFLETLPKVQKIIDSHYPSSKSKLILEPSFYTDSVKVSIGNDKWGYGYSYASSYTKTPDQNMLALCSELFDLNAFDSVAINNGTLNLSISFNDSASLRKKTLDSIKKSKLDDSKLNFITPRNRDNVYLYIDNVWVSAHIMEEGGSKIKYVLDKPDPVTKERVFYADMKSFVFSDPLKVKNYDNDLIFWKP